MHPASARPDPAGPPASGPAPRKGSEGWNLGSIAGVPVVLARSWVVIAVVITLLFAPTVARTAPELGGPGAVVVALSYALVLALSVLVHEVAHALTARAVGLPPTRIVLTLWGGHTTFASEASTPGRSFVISAVGPASNAVLAGLGALLVLLVPFGGLAWLLLTALTLANLFVAVFNLLPGLPLDGGRMLEAGVWKATGDRLRATVVAAQAGRVLAVLAVLVLLGVPVLRGGSPSLLFVAWAALVAGTLWTGASAVLKDARLRTRVAALRAEELLVRAVGVPADVVVAHVARSADAAGAQEVVLLAPDGRPVALVDRDAVTRVPQERWPWVQASSVARPLRGAPLRRDAAGQELVHGLAAAGGHPEAVTGAEVAAVVDGAGHVVGVLRGSDVVAAARARP
ncbi:site-2 protease family protein [Pseudokineococcus sp. 1T1Z-3]|uniref:site-2 protease family protein n=1 Tax=Pseudokineococcus sp. 1T1Z-3 TaxID=3132745 RepID=UPI0030B6DBFF